MKILTKILKNIQDVVCSLETVLNEEQKNLLSPKTNMSILKSTMTKKKTLLKKLNDLSKNRSCLEKKYNIYVPYENNPDLNNDWNDIVTKCHLLKKLTLKNKIVLNKKIYLNQNFLELFSVYQQGVTYNIEGNLKN